MTKNYREWIVQRNRQKRAYEALYHDIAVSSGLSDTVLWIGIVKKCAVRIHPKSEII